MREVDVGEVCTGGGDGGGRRPFSGGRGWRGPQGRGAWVLTMHSGSTAYAEGCGGSPMLRCRLPPPHLRSPALSCNMCPHPHTRNTHVRSYARTHTRARMCAPPPPPTHTHARTRMRAHTHTHTVSLSHRTHARSHERPSSPVG